MINDNIAFQRIRLLGGAMLAMVTLPYVGGYIYVHGAFPANYFAFPPLVADSKASFNWIFFGAGVLLMLGFALFYLAPGIFGFKKTPPQQVATPKSATPVSMPVWFWVGLVLFGVPLTVLWGHFTGPSFIINWAVLYMFWGFSMILDGIVYKRTNGSSLVTKAPHELIAIGVASVSGWLLFEFLNFFVDDNWCYPMGNKMPQSEFVIYAVVGSSGLMPMALEWYSLFNTFDKLKYRWSNGPKIVFPKWLKIVLLVGSIILMGVIPFFPSIMFIALWIAPMVILGAALSKLGIWTPFTGVSQGNWSPMALYALTYGIQGLLCECWNYFSGTHITGVPVTSNNPDYWTYSLPYINRFHVFEMPVLGLMGYLPFGVYCAVWWLAFANLLNIPTQFFDDGKNPISNPQ